MLTEKDESIADSHRLNWERFKSRHLIPDIATHAFLAADQFMKRKPPNKYYLAKAGVSEDSDNGVIDDDSRNRELEVKFRTKIYRAIVMIVTTYRREKYDYLLISNKFDRSQIIVMTNAYRRLLNQLIDMNTETRSYVMLECRHRRAKYGRTSIAEMQRRLEEDLDFLTPLAEALPANQLRYVRRAVNSAAKIYEVCTGEKVRRNINPSEDTDSEEFRNQGVEFIYVLLHAIDDEITRSNIATYARKLPR